MNNNRNTTFQVPNPKRTQCMSTGHVDNLNKLALLQKTEKSMISFLLVQEKVAPYKQSYKDLSSHCMLL